MLILLLLCLFKILPTDFSIPSGMKSRRQPAKVQPAEGVQNLGFAQLQAPGPPEPSSEQMEKRGPGSWHRWGLGAGLLLNPGRSPLRDQYFSLELHSKDQYLPQPV